MSKPPAFPKGQFRDKYEALALEPRAWWISPRRADTYTARFRGTLAQAIERAASASAFWPSVVDVTDDRTMLAVGPRGELPAPIDYHGAVWVTVSVPPKSPLRGGALRPPLLGTYGSNPRRRIRVVAHGRKSRAVLARLRHVRRPVHRAGRAWAKGLKRSGRVWSRSLKRARALIAKRGLRRPARARGVGFMYRAARRNNGAERMRRANELRAQAAALDRRLREEIVAFKPLGRMSEMAEALGVRPKRGTSVGTPLGALVFAKGRLPTRERIDRWWAAYRQIEELGKRQIALSAGGRLVIDPQRTIGNIKVLEHMEALDKEGLLDPDEREFMGRLRAFWRAHPTAKGGTVRRDGSIEPWYGGV